MTKSKNLTVFIIAMGLMLIFSFTASSMSQKVSAIGICEPDPNTGEVSCDCLEGTHEQGGTCVPDEIHCGSGEILKGNECVEITEEFKNQGQCIKNSHGTSSEVSKDICKDAFKSKNK